MFRGSLFFFAMVVLSAFAPAKADKNKNLLTVVKPKPLSIKAGEQKKASFSFNVKKGFHVQSNPASEKYLIPTVLKVEPNDKFVTSNPTYPACDPGLKKAVGPCKPHKLKGSQKSISTYEGTFAVEVLLTASNKLKPGDHKLSGKLRYQACNDQTCFFPKSVEVSLPIKIIN